MVEKKGNDFINYTGSAARLDLPEAIINVDVSKPYVLNNLYLEFITLGLITYDLPVKIEVNELDLPADLLDKMNYAPEFSIKPSSDSYLINFDSTETVDTKFKIQLSKINEDT